LTCHQHVLTAHAEEEVTWTPADDAESEPSLPMSMKVRKQLLELYQVISQSPDPNGTLAQVAQQNNMSPQELAKMLEKNFRELQENPSLLEPKTLPKIIFKMLASLGVAISSVAKKHPRSFSLTVALLLTMCYTMIMIPRTGLHISTSKGLLLSKGPTTIFSPPHKYVQKLIRRQNDIASSKKISLSVQTPKHDWDDLLEPLAEEEDGVHMHSLPRKHELKQAMTAQFTLSPDSILEEYPMGGETKKEIKAERDAIVDLFIANAARQLEERNLIEFSADDTGNAIRNVMATNEKTTGALIVPGLGNLGRYGMVFWRVTGERQSDESASMTLTTLKNMGFFDGQIHIQVERIPDHDGMLMVQVSLAVPKSGRKINNKLGQAIVSAIAQSLIDGTSRRTKQTLARKSQNRRYQESSKRRAKERRATRNEREKLIEEMAEDRRRRWQRANPNAGSYRPSSRRQRSPNNC
jgi:hypothetical protein